MQRFYTIFKLLILYLASPGSCLVSKYKLKEDTIMLFRMTINITYYTTFIAIFFIIKYS